MASTIAGIAIKRQNTTTSVVPSVGGTFSSSLNESARSVNRCQNVSHGFFSPARICIPSARRSTTAKLAPRTVRPKPRLRQDPEKSPARTLCPINARWTGLMRQMNSPNADAMSSGVNLTSVCGLAIGCSLSSSVAAGTNGVLSVGDSISESLSSISLPLDTALG